MLIFNVVERALAPVLTTMEFFTPLMMICVQSMWRDQEINWLSKAMAGYIKRKMVIIAIMLSHSETTSTIMKDISNR